MAGLVFHFLSPFFPIVPFPLCAIIKKAMENTLINIKKVSLIFFIITGFLHLGSSLLIANLLFLKYAFILNKTMDIPFVLTGLLYGFSSLRLSLTNPKIYHNHLDIFLISVIIAVLIGLMVINLAIPNLY